MCGGLSAAGWVRGRGARSGESDGEPDPWVQGGAPGGGANRREIPVPQL